MGDDRKRSNSNRRRGPDGCEDGGRELPTRRSILGGMTALTTASIAGCAATGSDGDEEEGSEPDEADDSESDEADQSETDAEGGPEIEGPIGDAGSQTGDPFLSAVHDLSEYGYAETEYVLSGTARADPTAEEPDDTAEYATRMVVYRPEDEDHYNGTTVVEWPNVSTQRDVPVLWINCYDYLMREGYAVVLISAQKVGVDDSAEDHDLVSWDPERYGDLHHPGDEYALDVFAQGTRVLRGEVEADPDPLDGLEVEHAIATGQSQSSHYLLDFINEVQESEPLFDGFAPVTTTRTPTDEGDIRDDLAPVLWVATEDEAEIERRPDGGQFRLWEVPGASHVNRWLSAWVEVGVARDVAGEDLPWDETVAGQFGQLAEGEYGECEYNYFPLRHAYSAAFDRLHEWVRDGDAPESAPRIEREPLDPDELDQEDLGPGVSEPDEDVPDDVEPPQFDPEDVVGVVTDEFGNAKGGVRLPPIDVPVATYDARADECTLFGRTLRFDDDRLEELYGTKEAYLEEFEAAADEAVEAGYLLPADAEDLLSRAETVDGLPEADESEGENVPVPTVEGPIDGGSVTGRPQGAAVHDIEAYDYVEEEYFVSGEARPVGLNFDMNRLREDAQNGAGGADGSGGEPDEPAEYRTRLLVYRPADPDDFNGEVLVDWPNVSTQVEVPVAWVNAYDYLMREGYVVVCASAQKVGVDDSELDRDLVSWDDERYGDLHHPGDDYAHDIFSQAVKSLRAETDPDPLCGLEPEHVYATGQSQSALYLQMYLSSVQADHDLIDGFLPTASEVIQFPDAPAIDAADTPVMFLLTEDEASGHLTDPGPTGLEDSETVHRWEVAGGSHVNYWLSAWSGARDARDFEGEDPGWDPVRAGQYGQLADAAYGVCGANYFPVRYAYNAALDRLSDWVRTGEKPPEGDSIELDENGEVVTDAVGNAKGGVRLPPIDVPVATYLARDQVCGGDEVLLGATERFAPDELVACYGTKGAYLDQLRAAADEAVEAGYLLEADADDLLARAETIDDLP